MRLSRLRTSLSALLGNRPALLALVGLSVFAVAVSAYALYARDSAARAWAEAGQYLGERDAARAAQTQAEAVLAEAQVLLARHDQTYKVILSRNAGIQPGDDALTIAKKLTDHLYQTTLFSGPWIDSISIPERYLTTISHETFNYCSSISSILEWALGLFGIEARSVVLVTERYFNGVETDSHVMVEALIDGRVVALDPTFGATYSCGDSPDMLNLKAMADCAKAGKLRHTYISQARPKRGLEDYYLPLTDLLYAIQATGGSAEFYQYEYPGPGWLAASRAKYAAAK